MIVADNQPPRAAGKDEGSNPSWIFVPLVGLIFAADNQTASLLIEPMKREMSANDFQIGLAVATAYYIAYGLLALPMGTLVDRLNRVRLLRTALAILLIGMITVSLSHGIWVYAAGKGFMGAAQALAYPAAMSLLADYTSRAKRAWATSMYAAGADLGQVAGLLLGGAAFAMLTTSGFPIITEQLGLSPWRAVSLVFALLGAGFIPVLLFIREPTRREVAEGRGGSMRELWRYRKILVPLFVGTAAIVVEFGGLRTWAIPALMRHFGLSAGQISTAASVVVIVSGLAAAVLAGKLASYIQDRHPGLGILLPAVVGSGLCVATSLVGLSPTPAIFGVVYALNVVLSLTAQIMPLIATNLLIPNELRGRCAGITVIVGAVGGMCAAPAIGLLSEQLGGTNALGWAMTLVALPAAAIATISFWIANRHLIALASETDATIS